MGGGMLIIPSPIGENSAHRWGGFTRYQRFASA